MSKDAGNVFLFYGNEGYLIKQRERALVERLVPAGAEQMNLSIFEDKSFSIEDLLYAAEALPFFNDNRLVIVRNAGFFKTRKADGETIASYLPNVPPSTTLLIIENEVDKRSKLYKEINKNGTVTEFVPLQEKELIKWVVSLFKEKGSIIAPGVAAQLLRTTSFSMEAVCSEAEKLIHYTNGKTITSEDINAVCTKSVESRIFELTGAIGGKRADEALQMYHNMVSLKESPIMILTMITRQFRQILQCGALAHQKRSNDEIANILSLRPFVVREYLANSRNFTAATLIKALRDCLEADLNIKTGKMSDQLSVEMLIVKYSL